MALSYQHNRICASSGARRRYSVAARRTFADAHAISTGAQYRVGAGFISVAPEKGCLTTGAITRAAAAWLLCKRAVESFFDLPPHIPCRRLSALLPWRRWRGPGWLCPRLRGWLMRCRLGPISNRLRRGCYAFRRGVGPRWYVALRPLKAAGVRIRVPASVLCMCPHLGLTPVIPPIRDGAARAISDA